MGNNISPSFFHLHVLSTECITEWTSPFAIEHCQLLEHHFPPSHVQCMQGVICSSVIKKNRGNWGTGILCFNQYCDSIGVPEEGHMPAPEFLLCLFVANYGASSVTNDCININDTPWFGNKALSLTVKGTSRLVPEECHRPSCPPVSIKHIKCLHSHLDLSNTFDASVFAIATITFYSCCCLGKLTIPSHHAFNPHFHATCDCKISQGVAHHGRSFTTVHIPWSKTQQSRASHTMPLFAWHAASGTWEPMMKEWFMNRCNNIFHEQGLQVMDSHSFHIEGTTWLLLLGVDPWIIKVIGRWSSAAFLIYWHKIEHILPDFISDAYESVQLLSTCMSRFISAL
ncbi:hypothetical protein K439DRAFT_1645245 [Ramaria rubella]|nr:hypothetical protein K439DRAFT_1645245 [Ramaria rubella]